MTEKKYHFLKKHYEDCFDQHGDSCLGVDWPNITDAHKRYRVMLDIIQKKEASILDFGCGLSHLYQIITENNYTGISFSLDELA